jgi:hypothetical protein
VKIYAAAVEALSRKETGDETELTTEIGGKTNSLGPSYFPPVVSFIFLVACLMPYYAVTGRARLSNRLTLRITLYISSVQWSRRRNSLKSYVTRSSSSGSIWQL